MLAVNIITSRTGPFQLIMCHTLNKDFGKTVLTIVKDVMGGGPYISIYIITNSESTGCANISKDRGVSLSLHHIRAEKIWRMKGLCFWKPLSKTDVYGYLEVPMAARYLPTGNEVMDVQDQNEGYWQFKALTRKDGRRCFTGNWRNFVAAASPRIGDTFRYYFLQNSNRYFVEIERQPVVEIEYLKVEAENRLAVVVQYPKVEPEQQPVEVVEYPKVEPEQQPVPDLILFGVKIFI
ncbi:hypothetical protein F0562_032164 [Nyssa sinensis]|uniref:TF-B3 domain-containing protein n=1 Tax=Nyssa sinensis TaxID=561372 RepID=A0A5J5AYL1_9ASTE|nr:hypothetical protein F0562_032164 [Nyssa sinensis]